jgi:mxaJ protein
MRWRVAVVLLACQVLTFAAAGAQSSESVLRVCADPNNLPFSNRSEQGFENKIASLVSRALGATLSYTWWLERDRLVRNTLDANRCDLLLGVPTAIEDALPTKPYYTSSYVFVYREDSPFHVQSLDDAALEKLRIGVHVMGDGLAPPAAYLAHRGIRQNVTGYSLLGPYGDQNPPAHLIEAVEKREVDVAIVWGPMGGFFARRQPDPLLVVPVQPDHYGPIPFKYSIGMAVRKNDIALRDRIDNVIANQADAIAAILKQFGVPQEDRP